MPMSLAEKAIQESDPIRKGIMMGIRHSSAVADLLSFVSLDSNSIEGRRYDELPSVQYVPINGLIPEQTVKGKPLGYSQFKMLHHIDIDADIEVDGDNIQTPSTAQIRLATKAAGFVFNDRFINGDRASDPDGPEGINVFVESLAAAQTIAPATDLDMRAAGTPTDAEWRQTLDLIDEAIAAVEGATPSVAFANRQFGLRLKSGLRQINALGADYDWTKEFMTVQQSSDERTFVNSPMFTYNGVPFFDIGLQRDQSTQIIGNTFTAQGSADTTRVFFVKLASDDIEAYEKEGLSVEPIGMLADKDGFRWRLKWTHGFAMWGARSLSRLDGIRVA